MANFLLFQNDHLHAVLATGLRRCFCRQAHGVRRVLKGISAAEITKRVTGKVTNGSIVLFHNAGEHTPEALPDILNYLLGEGYEIVPISKLLLTNEETYIDHTGRQCRSAET